MPQVGTGPGMTCLPPEGAQADPTAADHRRPPLRSVEEICDSDIGTRASTFEHAPARPARFPIGHQANPGRRSRSVEEIRDSDIGTRAGMFEVVKLGDEFFSFIVDCDAPKACTIVLRGASKDVLNEARAAPLRPPGRMRPRLAPPDAATRSSGRGCLRPRVEARADPA